MKKLLFAITLIVVIPCMSCSSKPNAPAVSFSDVIEKEWKLIEVHIDGKNINFDRNALADDGFGELFTLTFDNQNLSGVGAPNRYSVPYTQEKDRALSVKLARSTLMASIREPEKLKEHDFFTYIQNVETWNLVDNNLELYSKTEAGAEVTLVFSL